MRFAEPLLTSLLLFRILPILHGTEELSQMILCTIAVPTFVRAVFQAGRSPDWEQFLNQSLTATIALIWIGLCVPLFDQQHGLIVEPVGKFAALGELCAGLLAWILLDALARIAQRGGHRLHFPEDFRGWGNSRSLLAVLCAIGETFLADWFSRSR